MKSQITQFLSILILISCSEERQSTESIIENIESPEINEFEYEKIIESLSKENSYKFNELDDKLISESKMKTVLNFEKSLLDTWIQLPEYADTLEKVRDAESPDIIVKCGTRDTAPVSALRTPNSRAEKQTQFILFATSKIDIPTRIHIVNKNQGFITRDNGNSNPELHVTSEKIVEQIDILNNAFGKHNISFSVASIDSINNSRWNESGMDYYSRSTLHEMLDYFSQSPETHLNLYIIDGRTTGKLILGEATFPWDLGANKYDDYVVISARSLPNFYNKHRNIAGEGKTLIHEVGHYLGLWHTFEGGFECNDPNNDGCYYGDRVIDTPSQKYCHYGKCDCPGNQCDTCAGDQLTDPVNNYMGYNDDSCLNEFTLGQISRIYKATEFHRSQYFQNDFIDFR